MTISEAKELRDALERRILHLLQEFSEGTELSIDGIDITFYTNILGRSTPCNVQLGVRL